MKDKPNSSRWMDISVPLQNAMVHWPDDPPVRIEHLRDIEQGGHSTTSSLLMGAHTGTHMDAPLHFIPTGKGIDEMPLDTTIGRARVIEIHDSKSIRPEELVPHRIRRGDRILFKTQNSSRALQTDIFLKDFVFISKEAAHFLVKCGVRLVGIDYLSVGGLKQDGIETHYTLLQGGVWIIEGLNLSQIMPGKYDLVCLPLHITQSDGAPARAILRLVQTGTK